MRTPDPKPGEHVMRDSLHLRRHVTIRGTPGKTILREAATPTAYRTWSRMSAPLPPADENRDPAFPCQSCFLPVL